MRVIQTLTFILIALIGYIHHSFSQISPYIFTQSNTFSDKTFTVPANVYCIKVHLWGAGGGGGTSGAVGGGGAYVTGNLSVTPGETLTIIVGQGGLYGSSNSNYTYGGGGPGANKSMHSKSNNNTGGGGGRSAIRRGSQELVTAGAGGGAGESRNSSNKAGNGGAGGLTGRDGGNYDLTNHVTSNITNQFGGHGGKVYEGGSLSYASSDGAPTVGMQFQGGRGGYGKTSSILDILTPRGGGGGGGGYYGGAGGGAAIGEGGGGGGGGSSFIGGLINGTATVIPGVWQAAGNANHPYNNNNYGKGGAAGNKGQNGLVVIECIADANAGVNLTACPSQPINLHGTLAQSAQTYTGTFAGYDGTSVKDAYNNDNFNSEGKNRNIYVDVNIPSNAIVHSTVVRLTYRANFPSFLSHIRMKADIPASMGGTIPEQQIDTRIQYGPVFSQQILNVTENYNPSGTWIFRFRENVMNLVGTDANIYDVHIEVNYTLPTSVTWSGPNIISGENSLTPIVAPSTNATYTMTANSNGCISKSQVTVSTQEVSTAPTTITSPHPLHPQYCYGNEINLTAAGGTNVPSTEYAWYKGGYDVAHTATFYRNTHQLLNANLISITDDILRVTSTSTSPALVIDNLGAIQQSNYPFAIVKYRIVNGNPGVATIKTRYNSTNSSTGVTTQLINDNQWHIAQFNLGTTPLINGGNFNGYAFYFASSTNVTIDIDYIQLSKFPMIEDNQSTALLEWNSANIYFPNQETQTYAVSKIDACISTPAKTTAIILPAVGTGLGWDNDEATCYIHAMETVDFYEKKTGRYIASVTARNQDLGLTKATVYVEGTSLLVPTCSNIDIETAVADRHWVITPEFNLAASVKLPYTTNELTGVINNSLLSSSIYDVVTSQIDLKLSKYSGNGFNDETVDRSALNNCEHGGTTIHEYDTYGINPVPTITSLYSTFAIPSFSEMWLHGSTIPTPLSIDISDFSLDCELKVVTWKGDASAGISHYTIEKSNNGINWKKEQEIPVTTSLKGALTFIYASPLNYDYYRIKQFALDGTEKTSEIIATPCHLNNGTIEIYPNPSKGQVTIQISGTDKNVSALQILNLMGAVEVEIPLTMNDHQSTIELTDLQLIPGTYIVQLVGASDIIPTKLIIQ